jgi:hypothetical protein
VIGSIAPRAPGLIWVHGPWAGDVMVDGSIRGERLRPLGLWSTAALGRVSRKLREPAGRLKAIWDSVGMAEAIDGVTTKGQSTGSSASGPSSRRVWKQRRASLREIVIEARVWESPRLFSAR